MRSALRKFISALTPLQRSAAAALLCASIWTLFYFLFLRTPLPRGWTIRRTECVWIVAGAAGGALCRLISRRLWPVGLGAGAGIAFGGAEAYVSDVYMSYWQRMSSGLVLAPFPLFLWTAILGGWAVARLISASDSFRNDYER